MENTERAQVRLILEHERLAVQRTCQEELKALYADHAAKGCLQSGATAKSGIKIIDDLAEQFIKSAVDSVSNVAMDIDAFAMIFEEVESLFRFFGGEVSGITKMATGNKVSDKTSSISRAIQGLRRDAHARAMRQLEIHRFTFTKPRPIKPLQLTPQSGKLGAPLASAENAKPSRAGRLPADWWDDLWIEIFRQIHLGDLKPKSQADIVRAMQQWLSDNDFETGDSTLKPRARKLFNMLQKLDD